MPDPQITYMRRDVDGQSFLQAVKLEESGPPEGSFVPACMGVRDVKPKSRLCGAKAETVLAADPDLMASNPHLLHALPDQPQDPLASAFGGACVSPRKGMLYLWSA